jgi:hypothetical protein
MKQAPQIHSIYIARVAGEPMKQLSQVQIIAGKGIAGDRYASGAGTFSKSNPKIRHLSLIALSGIASANLGLRDRQYATFDEADTRRNIILKNISADELNALVGKVFYLGGIAFRGTELCAPCQRPAKLLLRQDFIEAFAARGGLRAEALETGTLNTGALLTFNTTS